jgi:hypothetical protein
MPRISLVAGTALPNCLAAPIGSAVKHENTSVNA